MNCGTSLTLDTRTGGRLDEIFVENWQHLVLNGNLKMSLSLPHHCELGWFYFIETDAVCIPEMF